MYKKLILTALVDSYGNLLIYHDIDISLNTTHSFKVERVGSIIILYLDDVLAASTMYVSSNPLNKLRY